EWERGELKGRRRGPRHQPRHVGGVPGPAGDRRVVGPRPPALGRIPESARGRVTAAEIFPRAAEADRVGGLAVVELPRIAAREPFLGQLLLPAVVDALLEQTVLVADAVAIGRDAERRQAVHVAG